MSSISDLTSDKVTNLRRRLFGSVSMAAALALTFGIMLLVTLGTIISASVYTAGKNTRDLLTQSINLTLDAVENGVQFFLQPVETQLFVIRQKLISGELDPLFADETSEGFMSGLLAAADQIRSIGILMEDGSLVYKEQFRRPKEIDAAFSLEEMQHVFTPSVNQDKIVWGAPLWSPLLQTTVINARLSLDLKDGKKRVLFAGIDLEKFGYRLDRMSVQLGRPVFAIHGRDRLLGHNGFDPAKAELSEETPLPHVSDAGDPVVAAFGRSEPDHLQQISPDVRGSGRRVEIDDVRYTLISRNVEGFSDLAWTIGTHIPFSEAGEQVRRFMGLIFLSLIVSFAAIAFSLWIGRRLSRPVERLARHAKHISKLEFTDIQTLDSSSIRELNTASMAFNEMTGALRWFETYVPKRLVRKLLLTQGPDGVPSEERRVTVMFTDIVDFTKHTTGMAPAEIAAYINAHFAILKHCIEEEGGTIDKYIGDSVMAFWGAPEPQPDQALRACRAALAIRRTLSAEQDTPAVRIGIHTGPTLVGNIGAPGRMNYTLVGETVNIAQHIEQSGKLLSDSEQTTILIAAATRAELDDHTITTEPVLNLKQKGSEGQLEVFRL